MPCATNKNGLSNLVLVAALFLWAFPANAKAKTDIVTFRNGDKLTGELKSLNRGQLNLNTDATGTIGIEWDKVSSVVSEQRIQVEMSSGARYFGNLARAEIDSQIVIATDDGPQTLDVGQVIAMK